MTGDDIRAFREKWEMSRAELVRRLDVDYSTVWRWEQRGDRAVPELFRFATRAGWETALERVLGVTSEQISQQWIESIRTAMIASDCLGSHSSAGTRPGPSGCSPSSQSPAWRAAMEWKLCT